MQISETAERGSKGVGALPPSFSLMPTPPMQACCHSAKSGRHRSPWGLKQVRGQEKGKLQLHFLTPPTPQRMPPLCQPWPDRDGLGTNRSGDQVCEDLYRSKVGSHLPRSIQMTIMCLCTWVGSTPVCGLEEHRKGSCLGRCGLRVETKTDKQVKNPGKVVVGGGSYTLDFSSPIFRLGNYGKGERVFLLGKWGDGRCVLGGC